MYFCAGAVKTQAPWTPSGGFSALYFILRDPHFARFDGAWLASFYPLTQVATATTMMFEWGAPLSLLATYFHATRDRPGRIRALSNRLRLRFAWIGVGFAFHVGLAVTMRLGIFPWAMLAFFPGFFRPAELERAIAKLSGR